VSGTRRAPARWGTGPGPPILGRIGRALADDRVLFLVALGLRLGLTVINLHGRVEESGVELGKVADHLLAGKGFLFYFYGSDVPRYAFFPPFYPAFLALLKLVFGPTGWVWAMQIIQGGVSAATVVLVRRLAGALLVSDGSTRSLPRPRLLAYAAAYATALWPPLIIYSAAAYSLTFDTFGMLVVLLFLVRIARTRRLAPAVKAGIAYGCLALSRPAFLGSLAFVPFGLRAMGTSRRRAAGATILTAAVALLTLSPWMIRNTVKLHRFVPVATHIGFNYLGGQNAYSAPFANRLCAEGAIRWAVIDRRDLETMNEADFDRMLLGQGLRFAVQHPLLTAGRCARRLFYFWWGNPDYHEYLGAWGFVYLGIMSVVIPLFLIGIGYGLRHRRILGLLLAVLLWESLFYMNFAVRGRYSLANHPLMLLTAVVGAAVVLRALARLRPRSAPARG
jgi:hypothetical protein